MVPSNIISRMRRTVERIDYKAAFERASTANRGLHQDLEGMMGLKHDASNKLAGARARIENASTRAFGVALVAHEELMFLAGKAVLPRPQYENLTAQEKDTLSLVANRRLHDAESIWSALNPHGNFWQLIEQSWESKVKWEQRIALEQSQPL